MPNKFSKKFNKGKSKRGNGRKSTTLNQDRIVDLEGTISFSAVNVSSSAATTTVTEFNLTASNLGNRLGQILDGYEYWRMTSMAITGVLLPGASTAGATAGSCTRGEAYQWGLSWNPISNVDTTAPTGFATQSDYPHFRTGNGMKPVGLSLGPSAFRMLVPWLTTSTTPDGVLQSAGTMTLVTISPAVADASVAAVTRLFARVHIQCKSPVDPLVSPVLKFVNPTRSYSIREPVGPLSEIDEKKANAFMPAQSPVVRSERGSLFAGLLGGS